MMTKFRVKRIIIIDDDQDNADLLAILLQRMGALVNVFYDVQAAIDSISDCVPDIIFIDIKMPEINGYRAAKLIRNNFNIETGMIIVALSGMTAQSDKALAFISGFDIYLTKPASFDSLKRIIYSK